MKGTAMYELSGRAENVDWSDVAMAGRAYADNIVGEPALTAAMHRMADEIDRQRAAADKALRDHFAAAALTGLLVHANDDIDEETLDTPSDIAYTAYAMADAMLRERCRRDGDCPGSDNAANHDAAPAAIASVDSVAPQPTARGESGRTDKAAPRPSEGTGDTPATHATQGEGSEQRECTEPVAWGVANGKGLLATSISRIDAVDMQSYYACDTAVVPLYRHPPCQDVSQKNLTLTDAEAETLRELRDEAAQYADEIGLCASEVRGRQRIIDGLLVRLGGER